jgi:hypothetical protein
MRVAAVGGSWLAALIAACAGSCARSGAADGGAETRPDSGTSDRPGGSQDGSNDPPRAFDAAPDDARVQDVGAADGARDLSSISDAGMVPVDVPPPTCVTDGELYFSPPQLMFVPGGTRSRAFAANGDRRVAVVAGWPGRPGVLYFDSLDGGRTFRTALQLSQFGPDNVRIAVGPRQVYLTSAYFGLYATVFLWHGVIDDLTDASRFSAIEWGPPGTYLGIPVPALDGRVSMLLENDTLGSGSYTGVYISTAPDGESFPEPHRLSVSPFCPGGIYHSSGKLFIANMIQRVNAGVTLQMRSSADNGATFSDPVTRESPGQRFACPKIHELFDGRLLVVQSELDGSLPERVVAATFDPKTNLFADGVLVDEGSVLCTDSARTTAGRLFVTVGIGEIGKPSQTVALRFSDDDGRTWSPRHTISVINPGGYCPLLAASDDELYLLWSQAEALMFGRVGDEGACH